MIQVRADHTISYTEVSGSWNEKNYYEFVKDANRPSDNVLKPYQMYHLFTAEADTHFGPGVREANKYDLLRIAKFINDLLPPLQISAFDLNRDTIEGDLIRSKYQSHQLLRDRKFLVWGDGQELMAFAKCDIASDAINIFGLFDKVELFIVDPAIRGHHALSALLDAAKVLYRKAGKDQALLLGDPDPRTDLK